MVGNDRSQNERAPVLGTVALLRDVPAERLARGQVGTVVDSLDEQTVLVEFSDDEGRAYAIVPCSYSDLLILHHVPQPVSAMTYLREIEGRS